VNRRQKPKIKKRFCFLIILLSFGHLSFGQSLSKKQALRIAKHDSVYQIKKIDSVELMIDSASNILCWVVVEKINIKKEQKKISHSKKTGMNYIAAHLIKINAQNGQVVRRERKILGSIHKHPKL